MPSKITEIKYNQEVTFGLTNSLQMFVEGLYVPGIVLGI